MLDDSELYDYIDIDCEDCGYKFFVRPLTLEDKKAGKEYPTRCRKCEREYKRFQEDKQCGTTF